MSNLFCVDFSKLRSPDLMVNKYLGTQNRATCACALNEE